MTLPAGLATLESIGLMEIIVVATVGVVMLGLPLLLIFLALNSGRKRKNATANSKKCPFCAYSIPIEATVCGVCRRDLPQ